MTKLEDFAHLVEMVPADKHEAFYAEMAEAAARYMGEPKISAEELAIIKKRLADPDPKYVSAEFLSKKYGVEFPS